MEWTSHETSEVIAELGSLISTALGDSDVVNLEGLGQFESKKKAERISVNPANGKRYLVPPKLVPVFKADNLLKTRIKELDGIHE
jgi:DNA-binding protein HU-beta